MDSQFPQHPISSGQGEPPLKRRFNGWDVFWWIICWPIALGRLIGRHARWTPAQGNWTGVGLLAALVVVFAAAGGAEKDTSSNQQASASSLVETETAEAQAPEATTDPGTAVPNVKGNTPQQAIDAIHAAGIEHTTLHGGAGMQEDTGFAVCRTDPAIGAVTTDTVHIYSTQKCKPTTGKAKAQRRVLRAEQVQARQAAREQAILDLMTPGQRNALGSAEDYLDTNAFSKSGLIEQLEYEDFSTVDATFAVEHLDGVSWKLQAYKSAKDYLDTDNFSMAGLVEQLEYEGFTTEEASYGAERAYK